jgi:uncharacterized protein YjbI with pentapeptide repeats
MEKLQVGVFQNSLYQARNAEEALLVALNSCSKETRQISKIELPTPIAFGAWIKRIQGQRTSGEPGLALLCLSYLDLSGSILDIGDFYGADFQGSVLNNVAAHYSTFAHANFSYAQLDSSVFVGSNIFGSIFAEARLRRVNFQSVQGERCNFVGSTITETNFTHSNLAFANFEGVDLSTCDLSGSDLVLANLARTKGIRKHFQGVDLEKANMTGSDLEGLEQTVNLIRSVGNRAKLSKHERTRRGHARFISPTPGKAPHTAKEQESESHCSVQHCGENGRLTSQIARIAQIVSSHGFQPNHCRTSHDRSRERNFPSSLMARTMSAMVTRPCWRT